MDSGKFYDSLLKKFDCKNDSALAKKIKIAQVSISQDRQNNKLSEMKLASRVKSAFEAGRMSVGKEIQPIVEFYPVSECDKSHRNIIDLGIKENITLKNILESAHGLYSFYNSELEVIYVGKANKTFLWGEILTAYNNHKTHYERYRVVHPQEKYRKTKNGRVRKITRESVELWEATNYFSAYSVPQCLIDMAETLLVRIVPNDLLNVRMEGNTSLNIFSGD